MATIRSILGDIEGSAGQLTFSKQNGKNILRQKVGRNGSRTPAQLAVRARFALLAVLYQALATLVKRGLPPLGGQSPYNRFVRLNFAATAYDALTGTASADYSQLVLSQPSAAVDQLDNLEATVAANGDVTARWAPDYGNGADYVFAAVVDRRTNRVYAGGYPNLRVDGGLTVATRLPAADVVAYCTLLALPVAQQGLDSGMTGSVAVTM